MNARHGWSFGKVVIGLALTTFFFTESLGAQEAPEIADQMQVVSEPVVPTSGQSLTMIRPDDRPSPPPGFPGRLNSEPRNGLWLKSLKVVGVPGKENWASPSIEYQAEFCWGRDKKASRDWESPVEMFLITFNEKSSKQEVDSTQPVLKAAAGHPALARAAGTVQMPDKTAGRWATVIVIGRDSPDAPGRLLAHQTLFVPLVPRKDVVNGMPPVPESSLPSRPEVFRLAESPAFPDNFVTTKD
ncbi:MAG: hypothetical protein MI861_28340 [Pirellulales bacterium]|nr:hypothetical protein [Pirellulales bacterium]